MFSGVLSELREETLGAIVYDGGAVSLAPALEPRTRLTSRHVQRIFWAGPSCTWPEPALVYSLFVLSPISVRASSAWKDWRQEHINQRPAAVAGTVRGPFF